MIVNEASYFIFRLLQDLLVLLSPGENGAFHQKIVICVSDVHLKRGPRGKVVQMCHRSLLAQKSIHPGNVRVGSRVTHVIRLLKALLLVWALNVTVVYA